MSLDTVLIAIGDTDRKRTADLAETAIEAADPAGATVELAHVFTREEYDRIKSQLGYDDDSEVTPAEVTRRYTTVREISDELQSAGIPGEIHGQYAEDRSKAAQIIELAERVDADRIIVGGRSRSPTGKAVFGSTAQEVMLNAPCPVTLVRAD